MSEETTGARGWVLVTGGSRGIGKGLVTKLAGEGYDVAFTFNTSAEAAAQVEQAVSAGAGKARGYRCDGSDFSRVEELCRLLIAERGAPYALVNNMGMTGDELIYNLDVERYRKIVTTNLDSAVFFNKCLIPAMSPARRGKIIHMSSVSALKGNKGQMSYAATKAAMIGVTRTLALELARFKITVNAIAPGYIATEMIEQISAPIRKTITGNIPLKRLGEVSEVAALTSFLLSESANYITGQTFVIDGGLSV
jgi:3-oxoacyl-[acyl-carrier protein] reductase